MDGIHKIRRALFGCFFFLGFAMANWIVRTPSIRDALSASTAEMGLVLFGFSVGSMTGILKAPRIVAVFGAGRSVVAGLVAAMSGLILIAAATVNTSSWVAALGLGMVGIGMAIAEVSVNILGAHVERQTSKSVLTLIHGCFSFGTAIGAVCGLGIVSAQIPVAVHMLAACVLLTPLMVYVTVGVYAATCNDASTDGAPGGFFQTLRQDRKLLLIGLIVVSVALSEGSANDWLPLLIVDSYGVAEKYGSLVFVAFAATMTVGRFFGTGIVDRFGPVRVMQASGLIGGLGILAMVVSSNLYVASIAVIMWAAGAALGFPVAMSAGAANGPNTSARISVLATIGYSAFLVGPPLLGFVGEHVGLRSAMLIVLVLQLFPLLFASNLAAPAACRSIQMTPTRTS